MEVLQHVLTVEEVHYEMKKLSIQTITYALGDVTPVLTRTSLNFE